MKSCTIFAPSYKSGRAIKQFAPWCKSFEKLSRQTPAAASNKNTMGPLLTNSTKSSVLSSLNPLRWGDANSANNNLSVVYSKGQPSGDLLIESAAQAVEQAMATIFRQCTEVPFCRPTDLAALPEADQACVQQEEIEQYRMRPELSAVHFCLTSVSALLEISQTLLSSPASPSPRDLERQWKRLAEDAKTAGRAAYRAVLILSDPARAGVSAE